MTSGDLMALSEPIVALCDSDRIGTPSTDTGAGQSEVRSANVPIDVLDLLVATVTQAALAMRTGSRSDRDEDPPATERALEKLDAAVRQIQQLAFHATCGTGPDPAPGPGSSRRAVGL